MPQAEASIVQAPFKSAACVEADGTTRSIDSIDKLKVLMGLSDLMANRLQQPFDRAAAPSMACRIAFKQHGVRRVSMPFVDPGQCSCANHRSGPPPAPGFALEFACAEKPISPSARTPSPHRPIRAQKFRLRRRANQWPFFVRPASTRGAYRDRHGRWMRDAMDALPSPDE
jgi:hypothetical protein